MRYRACPLCFARIPPRASIGAFQRGGLSHLPRPSRAFSFQPNPWFPGRRHGRPADISLVASCKLANQLDFADGGRDPRLRFYVRFDPLSGVRSRSSTPTSFRYFFTPLGVLDFHTKPRNSPNVLLTCPEAHLTLT
jgi:hypothetical protein